MITNPRSWLPGTLVALYDQSRFEAKATLGRLFSRRRYHFDTLDYLHLGCGDYRFEGFLNTDSFANRNVDLNIDLRFPLPLEDGRWRGVYAHHVVEHIGYEPARQLFRECFRILKPGGTFRVVVPDAEIFLRHYADADAAARRRIFELYPPWVMDDLQLKTPMEMVNYVFRDSVFNQHLFAWDFETLALRLGEAGFKVERAKPGESRDASLSGRDEMGWAQFSLYVDAIKEDR
jgi:predicted SAM-dependent methyltransferase